jgi:ribosomal-protein-alanine N-acetyltransferase
MTINTAFAGAAGGTLHPILIETPRLILREHAPADVDRIHEITSSPGFFYFCFDGSRTKAEEFVNEAIRTQTPDPVEGRRINHMLAIILKNTGEFVGHTCMERVHYVNGADYEVNFFVDPKYQNKGYGIEAILNLTDYGYQAYNLPSMTVTVDPRNGPSRHLIIKEGYNKVGDITMNTTRGVEPRELYIMTQAEFYQSRARDTRPILLSQVGRIPAPAPKAP